VDKTVEALKTMLGLLSPLKVENSRFKVATTTLNSEYRSTRLNPRNIASFVFDWARLGMTEDPRPARFAALGSKKSEALQSFAKSKTAAAPIISITGDSSRIDMKALGAIAPIKKTRVKQLFGY
jgi:hypothetical protein